jgi:hypothetical protein
VTVYDVISEPPSLEGTLKVIVARVFPVIAKTDVGVSGTVKRGISRLQQISSISSSFLDNSTLCEYLFLPSSGYCGYNIIIFIRVVLLVGILYIFYI